MLSCFENAFEEVMFGATIWALNQDPNYPKVITISRVPHEINNQKIPGSRWGIDNPDSVYRVIPIGDSQSYVIRGKLGKQLFNENHFTLWDENMKTIGLLSGNNIKVDKDGNFEIFLSIGDKMKVSYFGMDSIELTIVSSPVSIYMDTDVNQLEEVTVSVGYFDISEKDLSGSITQIKSEQLEKNRSGSVESILQGQVSGLVVSESSEPGGGSGVSIRGTNSILGGTQPLYVLDGIPVGPLTDAQGMGGSGGQQSSLSFINPNDIDKIEVLKDAASTCLLYTSDAADE